MRYLRSSSLGWVRRGWSLEILRLSRDIEQHLGTLRAIKLDIEVRTPGMSVIYFRLLVPFQLTVEGECHRLIMEQCERRAGSGTVGFST
jgi:hypothetical protein